MKKYIKILMSLLILVPMVSSCDENDPLPGYEVLGRSYETLAHVTVSDDTPLPGETITVTIDYVNYPEVPAESIVYSIERNGTEEVIDTRDESNTPFGEHVYTYEYEVPVDASVEEVIRFIGVFSSAQKEYPQVEIATIEIDEE